MSTNRNSGEEVGLTLGIAGAVAVVLFTMYEFIRYFIPDIAYYREYLNKKTNTLDWNFKKVESAPLPSKWPFVWMFQIHTISVESLLPKHGPDVVTCIFSLHELLFIFMFLSMLCMCVLAPTYATGPNKDLPPSDPKYQSSLGVVSMSNLKTDDPKLWVTWIVELITPIIIFVVLYRGQMRYQRIRQRYLNYDIPTNYTIMINDIPEQFQSAAKIREFVELAFPGQVARVKYCALDYTNEALKNDFWYAVMMREYWQNLAVKSGKRKAHKPGCCSKPSEQQDTIEYWAEQERELREKIEKQIKNPDPAQLTLTHTAFVMFYTKDMAKFAAQTNLWIRHKEFKVHQAPESKGVNWAKTNDFAYTRVFRALLFLVFLGLFLIFWGFVVAAIQSLGNLEALSKTDGFGWLSPVLDWPQDLINLIQGFLPPLLLMIIGILIPIFARLLISFQFVPDLGVLETRARDFYFVLLSIVNFAYVLGFGALLENINYLVENAQNVGLILAGSIPAQAVFMIKFVINNGFIGVPGMLVQYGRVFARPFIGMITGTTTPRQIENLNKWGAFFEYFRCHALVVSLALIGLVYSTMMPIINVFMAVFYAITIVVFKYVLFYSNINEWSGGGFLYDSFFDIIAISLYVKQALMTCLFVINKAIGPAVAMALPFILSLCAHFFIYLRFRRITRAGSVYQTHLSVHGEADSLPEEFYRIAYVSPGLAELPEVLDLNGVDDEAIPDKL